MLDLNAIIKDINKMLPRMIGEDIELVSAPGLNLGKVKADPTQIEQILMNLAVNARDAMPKGGRLTIETASVRLDGDYGRTLPSFPLGITFFWQWPTPVGDHSRAPASYF